MRRIGFGPAAVRSAFAVAIAAYALVGLFSITGHARRRGLLLRGRLLLAASTTLLRKCSARTPEDQSRSNQLSHVYLLTAAGAAPSFLQ